DTAKAKETLDDCITLPVASENLVMRAALYEVAKCNIFVSNGPAALCVMSDKPGLYFQNVYDKSNYFPETSKGHLHFCGFEAGGQWPIKTGQRIIWKPDHFDNIRDAWLEHMAPLFEENDNAIHEGGSEPVRLAVGA